jgi:peptidoglycan/xylan/chitin deacetylase (PgdA/CDA1 family)
VLASNHGCGLGRRATLLALVALAVVSLAPALPATSPAATAPTVVSLTFDDGYASHSANAMPILAAHGMHGTFFAVSNLIGTSDYMTWSQLDALSADGNEIGGHTLDHRNLTTVSLSEARRQVCADRNALLSHGFAVTDFAYPYGSFNSNVESIVQQCGYNSARTVLWNDAPCSNPCTESIPPRDPYATTIVAFGGDQTLTDIENTIMTAETYGGWAQIVIHRVCDACSSSGDMRPADLSALLDWLAPRAAHGTVVKTVQEVIGGPVNPPVSPDPSPTVPGAPGTPSGVAGDASVAVSWTAPTSDGGSPITGYTVTASPGGATCSTSGALSCTVTALTNGTAYTFTVRATNSIGTGPASAPSAPVTPATVTGATVPGAPGTPTGVAGDRRVSVSWTAPTSDGGSPITGYTVTASPGGATCSTSGPLSCTVTGLTNGTAYTFTVRATNSIGTGPASAPSAPVTPNCTRKQGKSCH